MPLALETNSGTGSAKEDNLSRACCIFFISAIRFNFFLRFLKRILIFSGVLPEDITRSKRVWGLSYVFLTLLPIRSLEISLRPA